MSCRTTEVKAEAQGRHGQHSREARLEPRAGSGLQEVQAGQSRVVPVWVVLAGAELETLAEGRLAPEAPRQPEGKRREESQSHCSRLPEHAGDVRRPRGNAQGRLCPQRPQGTGGRGLGSPMARVSASLSLGEQGTAHTISRAQTRAVSMSDFHVPMASLHTHCHSQPSRHLHGQAPAAEQPHHSTCQPPKELLGHLPSNT